MTWFKIDDKSAFHRKIVDAGNASWGALCRAGAWSAEHLTDGRIPWSVALAIAPRAIWSRLIHCELCETIDEEQFQIHDYLDWNPSREEVLRLRELRAESGRAGGRRRQAIAKQVLKPTPSHGQANGQAKINPVPVPVPVPRSECENTHTRPVDSEVGAIRDRIRHWPIFTSLNAERLADEQAGWMMSKGQKLAWVLAAVDDAATQCADGMTYQAKHSMLVRYMHNARRPRQDPDAEPVKVIESRDDPEGLAAARLDAEERRKKYSKDPQ